MKALRRWRESRRPAEFVYEVPKMSSAAEAFMQHSFFVSTVTALDLNIKRTEGARITLTGRSKNIAAFQRRIAVVTR